MKAFDIIYTLKKREDEKATDWMALLQNRKDIKKAIFSSGYALKTVF